MKRIKTWKRWAWQDGTTGIHTGKRPRDPGDFMVDIVRSSDLRKVMAVYNAAMKWNDARLDPPCPIQKLIDVGIALGKACERARK